MDLLFLSVCEMLRERGIVAKSAAMVLYAMVAEGVTYEAARDAYAEYVGEAPERLQSAICYEVLRAGLDGSPAEIFAEMAGKGVTK